ncbi:MAG: SpoIVB peptidase [Firmicutes bacterium]|nr:SpoIVB peptidase [Bacillota bacterium]
MSSWTRRRITGLLLVWLLAVTCASAPFWGLASIPGSIRLFEGREHEIRGTIPFVSIVSADDRVIQVRNVSGTAGTGFSVVPLAKGRANLEFRLFGVIPLKRLLVDVLPSLRLFPGGHSIGVLIHAQGVLVTGLAPVTTAAGKTIYPARDAGVEVGDMVLEVCGEKVRSDAHISALIDEAGRKNAEATLLLRKKDGREALVRVTPLICRDSGKYRIGMWVRDSAAGVGTLTFYEPSTGVFGALGHVITDDETDRPIDVRDGRIVKATVTGIEEGRRGQPGEKIGVFLEEKDVIGCIQRNTQFGIIGVLDVIPDNPLYPEPLPIGLGQDVREGPAEIITVVQGQKMERFRVEIQKVIRQSKPDGRGLIVKITDPDLINKAGGIVQGMSGSPIIQDGRLIGAITHVFVNDPTRGYGVFIEWMIMEAGLHGSDRVVGWGMRSPAHSLSPAARLTGKNCLT